MKLVQNISYIPHFMSWVILSGLFMQLFYRGGIVNNVLIAPLLGVKVDFFGDPRYFRSVLVVTDIWKNVGWGSIIYLAAITGISPELYESAYMDGARRLQQTWYITLPSIMYVVSILLILSLGGILNAGFEQVFLFYSPMVMRVGDIIDTYVYRVGLVQMNYSYSTAVGFLKGLVSAALILSVNKITRAMGQQGIW